MEREMKRWNRGALIAVVIAIATATGLLNQPRAEAPARAVAPAIELTYSLETMSFEVRTGGLAIQIEL
jgi:hypothetical protein